MMQATHYVPDELEPAQRGKSEPTFMEYHADFAEEVLGEKRRLVAEAIGESQTLWQGLYANTKHKRWVLGVWAMELMWILFILMANSMEMWGMCPYDMHVSAACLYCYSGPFLAWGCILVTFWGMDLFLSVLLASRGFRCIRGRAAADAGGKDIPKRAVALFYAFLAVIAIILLAGVAVAALSASCNSKSHAYYRHPRSQLMLGTTISTLFVAPLLLLLGRVELC